VLCLCRLHNYCIQNRLRKNGSQVNEFNILEKDNTYLIEQCDLNHCDPIKLDTSGIPTELLDEYSHFDDALLARYSESSSNIIPMNVMIENTQKQSLERPNIIQTRAKKRTKRRMKN